MKKFRFIFALVFVCAMTVFAFIRSEPKLSKNAIQMPDSILLSGDIIFREGRGVISTMFSYMSQNDKSYSHAGIIHLEDQEVYVIHIIGGEGRNSVIRKELLSSFCNPNEANAIGVYRSSLNAGKIDSVARKLLSDSIRFDDKFDLTTDDKMYCTEFVYKVLNKVSNDDNFIPLSSVNEVAYCACDNIFLSSHVRKTYSYKYK